MKNNRGWEVLKTWGFWFWLIVYLPGHRKERRQVKKNEKTLRDIHRR